MSFYANRLETCVQKRRKYNEVTRWLFGNYQPSLIKIKITGLLFSNYTLHNFEVCCVGTTITYRKALDSEGNLCNEEDKVANYGEPVVRVNYESYAWDTTDRYSSILKLTHPSQFSVVSYYGTSRASLDKRVNKRLDLLKKLHDVHDELKTIVKATQHAYEPVFNASINDHVFVKAFGRLRKGIVVETIGSHFIVGYLTPSNLIDVKYKSVRLSSLYQPV